MPQFARLIPLLYYWLTTRPKNHILPQHDDISAAASVMEAAAFICSTYWNWHCLFLVSKATRKPFVCYIQYTYLLIFNIPFSV